MGNKETTNGSSAKETINLNFMEDFNDDYDDDDYDEGFFRRHHP